MTGRFKIISTTNSVLYCLTFLHFTINIVTSQNLPRNAQFVEPTVASLENSQVNHTDQLINDFQKQFKNHEMKKAPSQHELQLRNKLKESPEEYKPNLLIEIQTSVSNILNDVENGVNIFMLIWNLNISMDCLLSLWDLKNGLRSGKLWAIRMVDAFGRIPIGILDGSRFSFGDYDMCLDTELPGKYRGMFCTVDITLLSDKVKRVPFKPIDLSFMLKRDFSKSIFDFSALESFGGIPVTTSICLPSNCSKSELQNIITEVTSYVDMPIGINVTQCDTKEEFQLSKIQSYILFVMLILILFELFATILDLHLRCFYKEQFDKMELSKSVQYTLAFSFYSNTISLFKKSNNPDSIAIFHGMKVISMSWIICSHTVFISFLNMGRMYEVLTGWTKFLCQIVPNGFLAVETFFFIGGFLVMYTFIKVKVSEINFAFFALGRFIRLMPPVLFMIGCALLSENMTSGPMSKFVTNFFVEPCKTKWWRNLLLVNNLYDVENSCLVLTWYLATDMQLYLISYPILLLMKMNVKQAVLALKIIIVSSVGGLIFYHVFYHLPPHPTLTYIHFRDAVYYVDMIHVKPHNHITPYFVGMFAGYIIATNKKIILTGRRQLLGWFIAIICLLICLFTTYIWNSSGRPATILESAIYGGSNRLLWSMMLSWVVYTCVNGKAGKVTSILSWDGFVPFARLTFMVFFIHPILEILFVGRMKYTVYPDATLGTLVTIGFLVISYIVAFPACLICEAPFIKLTNILLSSKLKQN